MVYIFHNLLKNRPVYLHQLTISQSQYRGRSRCIVHYAQISKRISISECAFLLVIDLYLADSLEDDIIASAFVALFENVCFATSGTRFHLLDETVDLNIGQL